MKKTLFILSLILTANSLLALSIPKKSELDGRIVTDVYKANDVTQIYAKNGYTTLIKLEKDERVTNIASGFNDGWDFKDRENFVFIKPIAYVSNISVNSLGEKVKRSVPIEPNKRDWSTNLIITTNKREYVFDLILANHSVYYKVNFNYPAQEAIKRIKDIKELEAKKEKEYIKKELDKTVVPRNWEFYMTINKDSEEIAPSFAYDDGVFTYLGYDTTKIIPSAFLYDNEKESILNTHIKKDGKFDVLVIHKISKMIVLRSGKKIVGILNKGYAKNPLSQTRETVNENVKREVIENEN